MKTFLFLSATESVETVMKHLGYIFHCVENGRACYHRRLNDPPFPRFHVYASVCESKMEIDLHFDALDEIDHKGNHDQAWAYEGGRNVHEMCRINAMIAEKKPTMSVETKSVTTTSKPKRKNFFEILFR